MKVVYRVINAIFGALIFVAAFFLKFFHVEIVTSESLADVIYSLTENKTGAYAIAEEFSIKRIIDVFTGNDTLSSFIKLDGNGSFLWPSEFHALNVRMIVFLSSFLIAMIACISDKRVPNLILGILGIVAIIAMIASFNSMSEDVYNGTVNVIDYIVDRLFTNELVTSLLGAAASTAISLEITLAGMQNGLLFIFIGVAAWSLINILVDVGDPKAKAEQDAAKAAKAEKKSKEKSCKASKSNE